MTGPPATANPGAVPPARPSPASVLADRIAAALIQHEPGWRLPRLTALARRYNTSVAEVDAAIDVLTARHLLRRLPGGQVYRASPAEYQVPLTGLAGLLSRVDPMGGELTCSSRRVSARRVPEDTSRALGLTPGETVLVVKCLWLVGGEPGAVCVTYLPQRLAGLAGAFSASPLPGHAQPAAEPARPDGERPGTSAPAAGECAGASPAAWPAGKQTGTFPAGQPSALQLELGLPSPSVARSLRLAPGQPVATVAVRFSDPQAHQPVALTLAMFRPDLLRIVVQAADGEQPDLAGAGLASAWTQPAEGWEP